MKVLVIGPTFFSYRDAIVEELKHVGIDADAVNDRPSESVFFKSFGRLNYNIVQRSIDRHFALLLDKVKKTRYDMIFYIGGMSICFSGEQVMRLRESANCPSILYLWDSLKNCQRVGSYLHAFDYGFSFDPNDCKLANLSFLPLFYTREYDSIQLPTDHIFDYDACFIGSVHQIGKFKAIRDIVDALKRNGAKVFSYYYLPSKSVGLLRKCQSSAYRDVELKFKSLDRAQILRLFACSKTIIDSPQENQSGLTMRSIEALGARRKLLTTNSCVSEYDFFNPDNIMITSNDHLAESLFAKRDPSAYSESIRKQYSISSWLESILKVVQR